MGKVNTTSALQLNIAHWRQSCKRQHNYDNLREKFVVGGFGELGACTGTVTATADSEVTHLTKKGILIFWGDSNDVGKNNTQN